MDTVISPPFATLSTPVAGKIIVLTSGREGANPRRDVPDPSAGGRAPVGCLAQARLVLRRLLLRRSVELGLRC